MTGISAATEVNNNNCGLAKYFDRPKPIKIMMMPIKNPRKIEITQAVSKKYFTECLDWIIVRLTPV